MDRDLIVITPCSRPQELVTLNRSITFRCTWIIVFDAPEVRATVDTADATVVLLASPGGIAGKHQVNTGLAYCREHGLSGFVYVLDDDNVMHEDFFTGISASIASGKRGYIFQQQISPDKVRAVSPGTTRTGYIDQGQFILHTDLLRDTRYQQHYDADGYLIEALFAQQPDEFEFVHKTLAYYNRLRWDAQVV
jgi:hypothetical protein